MKIHAPLVFDVVDLLNEQSIGDFTYYVAHPGGRSFENKYRVGNHVASNKRASEQQYYITRVERWMLKISSTI